MPGSFSEEKYDVKKKLCQKRKISNMGTIFSQILIIKRQNIVPFKTCILYKKYKFFYKEM